MGNFDELKDKKIKKMNDLIALQNKLFEAMEWLQDREIEGDKLQEEIRRQLAFNDIAKSAIANGALMLKCSNDMYGLPVDPSVPLIPCSPDDDPKVLSGKRDSLISLPKGRRQE